MTTTKPHFSESADRNKQVISAQLRKRCRTGAEILEIGSGTGQHALHFAKAMADIIWQPSDRDLNTYDLATQLAKDRPDNLRPPIALDVANWPNFDRDYDAVYSANCIHTMPHTLLEPFVRGAANTIKPGGLLMLYGPFRYDGAFTTPSNESFDAFLRGTYEGGGIRDFEELNTMALKYGLSFDNDTEMPSNNQFIVWQKSL